MVSREVYCKPADLTMHREDISTPDDIPQEHDGRDSQRKVHEGEANNEVRGDGHGNFGFRRPKTLLGAGYPTTWWDPLREQHRSREKLGVD